MGEGAAGGEVRHVCRGKMVRECEPQLGSSPRGWGARSSIQAYKWLDQYCTLAQYHEGDVEDGQDLGEAEEREATSKDRANTRP